MTKWHMNNLGGRKKKKSNDKAANWTRKTGVTGLTTTFGDPNQGGLNKHESF